MLYTLGQYNMGVQYPQIWDTNTSQKRLHNFLTIHL